MYIPESFAIRDLNQLHDWIEAYSFASLVSAGGERLEATHLPLLLERGEGRFGTLVGHFAKANGQWQAAAGAMTLAMFHGPHAYISPRWYDNPNLVPTWNYIAVHAYGRLELIDDLDATIALVRRMTQHYEASFDEPWQLQLDDDSLRKLAMQVVAFRLPIEWLEGKAKLSQNHPAERQRRVIEGLIEQNLPAGVKIAERMSDNLTSGSQSATPPQ
jgi:transcriptional regulator